MLSVVLAVHNEELNLSKCLQSIAKIADEIIVVDGESTDRTVSIAKEFGAKIIVTTNKSNFHINKQIAMDAAKGDLVLQLDADEVVDDELAKYIVSIEQNKVDVNQEISAWWIPRKNYFLGAFLTKGGQYPDMVIRLYRNGKAALPQKDVHEQMTATGPVSTVKGHIIHYSNPTFSDYIRKFNTYTTFTAIEMSKKKIKPTIFLGFSLCIYKPVMTFFKLFLRHKGFYDGIPGFVFAVMSGLHHPVAFLKLWELQNHV